MLKNHKSIINRFLLLLIAFSFVFSNVQAQAPGETPSAPADNNAVSTETVVYNNASQTVYVPIVARPSFKFAGIYLKQYWNEANVRAHMPAADQAAGKKHTSVGWFIDLEDDALTIPVTFMPKNNLYRQLEELWKAGYISFVNLSTNATAGAILRGERDRNIDYAAEYYKKWLDLGQGRKAMIAPLQEMNGDWTAYGLGSSPEENRNAYRYIVNRFYKKGIKPDQVWWVFAPNAWNPDHQLWRKFENYYPGDDVVDFVGFSSYNYGFCPSTAVVSGKWESYKEVFEPFIIRMKAMAPTKPLIIAETATTAYYDYKKADENRKNQWLIENYNYLASHPDVDGVFYFSFTEFDGKVCDFEVALPGKFSSGYRDGLANPIYRYVTPVDIDSLAR